MKGVNRQRRAAIQKRLIEHAFSHGAAHIQLRKDTLHGKARGEAGLYLFAARYPGIEMAKAISYFGQNVCQAGWRSRVCLVPRRLCKATDQSSYVVLGVQRVWGDGDCGTVGSDEPHQMVLTRLIASPMARLCRHDCIDRGCVFNRFWSAKCKFR